MKKIAEGIYECPNCHKSFPIGELFIYKSGSRKGKPAGLCRACDRASVIKRYANKLASTPEQMEAHKQSDARRRLEELREQKALEE